MTKDEYTKLYIIEKEMIFRCKRLKLSLSDPSIIIERGMLLGELYKANAIIDGEFGKESYPTLQALEYKIESQIKKFLQLLYRIFFFIRI